MDNGCELPRPLRRRSFIEGTLQRAQVLASTGAPGAFATRRTASADKLHLEMTGEPQVDNDEPARRVVDGCEAATLRDPDRACRQRGVWAIRPLASASSRDR